MGNEQQNQNPYQKASQNLHHHHPHPHLHLHLPIFCSRSSGKDVHPHRGGGGVRDGRCTPSSTAAGEPISPRVSCIGNVKRSSRVIGFPVPHKIFGSPTTTPYAAVPGSRRHRHHYFDYHKLKKLFSAKNLIYVAHGHAAAGSATGAQSAAATAGGSSRGRRIADRDCKAKRRDDSSISRINIVDMDPPLPVPAAVRRQENGGGGGGGGEAVSLWKRRSGGIDLEGLQIQQIRLGNQSLKPLSV